VTKVYHGTTAAVALAALDHGLQPRQISGSAGNWAHTVSSHPEMVYLTAAYAPYYSLAASTIKKDERLAIVEVDLDKIPVGKLGVDEDWVEQSIRNHPDVLRQLSLEKASLKRRMIFVRRNLHLWAHLWESSLKGIGNCCVRGTIPPAAITRISTFDVAENAAACHMAMEPTITIANYLLCGEEYRALTKYFVGDPVKAEELMGGSFLSEVEEWKLERFAYLQRMIDERKVEKAYEAVPTDANLEFGIRNGSLL